MQTVNIPSQLDIEIAILKAMMPEIDKLWMAIKHLQKHCNVQELQSTQQQPKLEDGASIDDLNLSHRLTMILKRHDILTVRQLTARSGNALLKLGGVGHKAYYEIVSKLAHRGHQLADS